ncbi:MAG: anti-sigma factor [Alphaproteobacteria bacterium]|nr:anti-sigma factor [Alphaproteobacteria bacterium]
MSAPAPGCDKVLLVQAELDGELGAAEAAALAAHRSGCPLCQKAEAELLRTRALLRGEPYAAVPEAVRARVMARLRQHETRLAVASTMVRPGRRLWLWPSLGGFGLGAACAAALAFLLVLPQGGDLAVAVVASHVRALQPGHLEDVASTDQHTVKPWFDGRIDFAPPVRDFAAAGFPLQGGRLDYLDGRPVAALVYQRDKHIIDLYIWPASTVPRMGGGTAIHGYNLAHWTQDGMTFWAVSDVEGAQLDEFAKLWRRGS